MTTERTEERIDKMDKFMTEEWEAWKALAKEIADRLGVEDLEGVENSPMIMAIRYWGETLAQLRATHSLTEVHKAMQDAEANCARALEARALPTPFRIGLGSVCTMLDASPDAIRNLIRRDLFVKHSKATGPEIEDREWDINDVEGWREMYPDRIATYANSVPKPKLVALPPRAKAPAPPRAVPLGEEARAIQEAAREIETSDRPPQPLPTPPGVGDGRAPFVPRVARRNPPPFTEWKDDPAIPSPVEKPFPAVPPIPEVLGTKTGRAESVPPNFFENGDKPPKDDAEVYNGPRLPNGMPKHAGYLDADHLFTIYECAQYLGIAVEDVRDFILLKAFPEPYQVLEGRPAWKVDDVHIFRDAP